jgi:hypothetical protein
MLSAFLLLLPALWLLLTLLSLLSTQTKSGGPFFGFFFGSSLAFLFLLLFLLLPLLPLLLLVSFPLNVQMAVTYSGYSSCNLG